MVREMEHQERDVVWVVLDASVELWSGAPGVSPLDIAIDDAAARVDRHARAGDKVGLLVVASRVLARVEPGRGPRHAAKLHETLANAAACYDRDRSDSDEADVALRVVEHLRPLDANGLADVSRRDLDKLAQRAIAAASKAPFRPPPPDAPTSRERRLRQYLAAFGVECPPRTEPESSRTVEQMTTFLNDLAKTKHPATILYIVGPPPRTPGEINEAIRKLARRGVATRWVMSRYEPALSAVDDGRVETGVLVRATIARTRFASERATRGLRRLGVKIERGREPVVKPLLPAKDEAS